LYINKRRESGRERVGQRGLHEWCRGSEGVGLGEGVVGCVDGDCVGIPMVSLQLHTHYL
jgi:hypothetical protein